jgi:hypothetical protein
MRAIGQNPGVLPELKVSKYFVSHSGRFCPVALSVFSRPPSD